MDLRPRGVTADVRGVLAAEADEDDEDDADDGVRLARGRAPRGRVRRVSATVRSRPRRSPSSATYRSAARAASRALRAAVGDGPAGPDATARGSSSSRAAASSLVDAGSYPRSPGSRTAAGTTRGRRVARRVARDALARVARGVAFASARRLPSAEVWRARAGE